MFAVVFPSCTCWIGFAINTVGVVLVVMIGSNSTETFVAFVIDRSLSRPLPRTRKRCALSSE
ncbi:MAG: hypothetical protein JWR80_7500 [Bradyrhizobium sp.]|nr:hypothetical protein [Bradyrhizobium sp.]